MDIKHIDDEATARKLLNCIAAACGFKSVWLSFRDATIRDATIDHKNYIIFGRKDESIIHGIADIVTFQIESSSYTYVKAVNELLDRLDKQGRILLKDYSLDECPVCWLNKEDVFSNDILKFEAALIGVELNG